MPYLGKCISCNWACIAELQSEVKGVLKKHSEGIQKRSTSEYILLLLTVINT